MSAIPKTSGLISPEEYLEGELLAEIRHEYVYGHVYAMGGASDDHNRIAGNIFNELSNRLRGRHCEAFINDMKAKVLPDSHVFYYPDVMVVCDPSDNAKYFRERPPSFLKLFRLTLNGPTGGKKRLRIGKFRP
jgi:Uma2 family endonuclease